jgi:uncharacterized membrane protein
MMPTRNWLLLSCVLVGVCAVGGRPSAEGPSVTFHRIGDLPGGGAMTIIRGVARVDTVIHAVGGAVDLLGCGPVPSPCPTTDASILWRSDSGSATPIALPDLVTNPSATSPLSAFAITADGAFIASQARNIASGGTRQAVRFAAATQTNVDLSTLTPPVAVGGFSTPTAISHDGSIVYGFANGRGIRWDVPGGTSFTIPVLCPTLSASCPTVHTVNPIASNATSADGSVAVGFSGSGPSDHRAFRYQQGVGVSAIPLLAGGPFRVNDAVAVSPDGDLMLVTGDSEENPNGEAYLYRASNGAITPLGVPNGSRAIVWRPGGRLCANGICNTANFNVGGMSSDGSVVVMNFTGVAGAGGQGAYFRNTHGWFNINSILAANGANIAAQGWDNLFIQGISPDGTLVFGAGERVDPATGIGRVEGFVADFKNAAIPLKDYNPQPVPVADTSIVGAWTDDLLNPGFVFVFTKEGVFYHIEDAHSIGPTPPPGTRLGTGFERGLYTFDGAGLHFTTLVDTNGDVGTSGGDFFTFPVTVNGNVATFDDGSGTPSYMYRVVSSAGGPPIGGWLVGDPTVRDHSFVAVTLASGQMFQANDHVDFGSNDADRGAYTLTPTACSPLLPSGLDCLRLDVFPVDGGEDLGNIVALSADGLGLITLDDDGHTIDVFTRVIDPKTIPVIGSTPLAPANGTVGASFAYDVDATNTSSFTATGLPAGLSIDPASGVISGLPSVGGHFVATIKATSAVGVSDIDTLTVTIAIPTAVGANVTVEPVVPAGQGPITVSFDQVTSAGATTVETVTLAELQEDGVPPPGSVEVGGVIYNVSTTAAYSGLIELCFSYEGVDFGNAEPRLFHYENNVWVDITTSVQPETKTICGATTSLSPFAVLVSDVVRKGFYTPLNPLAGYLNVVKGGATVPLKFEVFVNGVEQTSTNGLTMTVRAIACDTSAPLDPVEPEVAGGTGLRYDSAGGYFVQNWKAPRTAGCYMVQVTTQQDNLALTARFSVR